MSLTVDEVFWHALRQDQDIMEATGERVYTTAITIPPADLDNVDLPYVIISFDGGDNDQSTKDDYEGDSDSISVGIEVAAKTREDLGTLMHKVRQTVRDYFREVTEESEDYDLIPDDYQLSFSAVSWDWEKPCFWQKLTYQCSSDNDTE